MNSLIGVSGVSMMGTAYPVVLEERRRAWGPRRDRASDAAPIRGVADGQEPQAPCGTPRWRLRTSSSLLVAWIAIVVRREHPHGAVVNDVPHAHAELHAQPQQAEDHLVAPRHLPH